MDNYEFGFAVRHHKWLNNHQTIPTESSLALQIFKANNDFIVIALLQTVAAIQLVKNLRGGKVGHGE